MRPRAVITGIGLVTPIGNGIEGYWAALTAGKIRSAGARSSAYYLQCSRHHNRGATVCPNGQNTPLGQVEDAVLGVLQRHVLKPEARRELLEIVEQQVGRDEGKDERKALEARGRKLEAEVSRLVDELAGGLGNSERLRAGIAKREAELAKVKAQLGKGSNGNEEDIVKRVLVEARRMLADLETTVREVMARRVEPKGSFRAALGRLLNEARILSQPDGGQRLALAIAPAALLGDWSKVGTPRGT